jgi:hypothetical protein
MARRTVAEGGGEVSRTSPTRPTHDAAGKARLVRLSLDAIRPSPENELIYRPVDPEDPEIQDLAESIVAHGLREPIVITKDHFILSGHRRYAACRLAGLSHVPCRIEDISSTSPEFERLLCEYNRQRVKSFAEVVRERVVTSVDPEEAYASLLAHRKSASKVDGDFLILGGVKFRKRISEAKMEMLKAVKDLIWARCDWWPLSDRSIHYDLLNAPPLRHSTKPNSRYANDKASYKDLTDLLTRARLSGEIPFDSIEDPTRTVCVWGLHRDVGGFLNRELADFLRGYWRDLQQSQPDHIEIVGEKNTIESSIRDVAMRFCIPYTLGRGYCSLDPRRKMFERYRKSGKKSLVILIMSDFDPEGEDIAHSFARSMRDDFGVEGVVARKVALTHEQVLERDLPQTFDIKKTSNRYRKFAAKYGDRAHELEALDPAERSRLLTEAIDQVLDIDAFNRELDAEKADAARIARLREAVGPALRNALDEMRLA